MVLDEGTLTYQVFGFWGGTTDSKSSRAYMG